MERCSSSYDTPVPWEISPGTGLTEARRKRLPALKWGKRHSLSALHETPNIRRIAAINRLLTQRDPDDVPMIGTLLNSCRFQTRIGNSVRQQERRCNGHSGL